MAGLNLSSVSRHPLCLDPQCGDHNTPDLQASSSTSLECSSCGVLGHTLGSLGFVCASALPESRRREAIPLAKVANQLSPTTICAQEENPGGKGLPLSSSSSLAPGVDPPDVGPGEPPGP
ncbi:hypothetical protein NL676_038940 [Syzygium grande]|nr:hypothetical protein NL676_038940 [Syzygium grande]